MRLPLIIHQRNRPQMLALCGLVFLVGYMIPNHIHFFKTMQLPMLWIDEVTPFWTWTFFIYASEYFLFVAAYFLFNEDLTRNRAMWAFLAVTVFAGTIFFLFPILYPRENYPIPADTHWIVEKLFTGFRVLDSPGGTLPSLHVACCFLTAFSFLPKSESQTKFRLFFTWAILISLSTMTTKQHYFVDVISGLLLGWVGYWVFFKKVSYVPLETFFRK